MPRSDWQAVRRLLTIRLDNVGDVIMLGPSLRALRHALPSAHLALLASNAGSQVAPLLPWLDDVLTARVVWQDASNAMRQDPNRELALVDTIRRGHFDAAIIFTSFSQSPWPPAYACYLAGVPIRVGQSKEFGGSLLTTWVRPGPDYVHQVDRNLSLIEALGIDGAGRHLELHPDAAAQSEAETALSALGIDPGRGFVVAAPFASCAARTYPLTRFREVIARLPEATRLPVVVVGGPREREVAGEALANLRGVHSMVGETSLPRLAALIARATLVVANNSGPMHIADAFRVPQVVLYSGSEYEEQWRPRSSLARLLRRPTDCSPCYRFTCPYSMECLDIQPAEVVRHCVEIVECRAGVVTDSPLPAAGGAWRADETRTPVRIAAAGGRRG